MLIHGHYWGLESYRDKVNYFCSFIHEFSPLRPTSGKKSHSILRINGKDARVCKDFFISTFDISQSTATTFMTKKRKGPDTVADLRRKQRSSNKIPVAILRLMREHILSQTGPQGRLDQASSADGIQNVQKLYNHYHSECQVDNIKPAGLSIYCKAKAEIYKAKNQILFESPYVLNLHSGSKKKLELDESKSGAIDISSWKGLALCQIWKTHHLHFRAIEITLHLIK